MQALNSFKGIHRGSTILVCGCGESLNQLTRPERFISIGVNDVGRRFHPRYLVVVNPREQFAGDRFHYVETSKANYLFTQLDLGVEHPHIVKFQLGVYGGTDFSDPNVLHYTQNSPYVALCLAAHMGASRIGLIGVDFTDHHFFAQTGVHSLTPQLATIDEQYRKLGEAMRARGIEVWNLGSKSRLTAFPKMPVEEFAALALSGATVRSAAPDEAESPVAEDIPPLKIISYATTPVAGVPAILARCINARTRHKARCVWAQKGYGNGVVFEGDIEWNESPAEAEAALAEADVVIVHNGKVESRHERLLQGKAIVTMAHNYAWNVDLRFVKEGFPGVIIGQYQATLPEFVDWAVVPNPVPLWEAVFQPEAKPAPVTIAFTPSGKHERYPCDHRLYWHGKGYDTTMRALEELSRRFPLRLETIRDRQVSHAEALEMKRRAHIVIDECVTGSYHRNSLEGLATGCVVVNGVGLLPGLTDVFRRCTGGAAEIPFVHSDLEELEQRLSGLIEQGVEILAAEGGRNRIWMETHWDFARQWDQFWAPVILQALQRAGREWRSARIDHPQSSLDPIPSGHFGWEATTWEATTMDRMDEITSLSNGVSVVIPHGGAERLPNLAATLANLRQCSGTIEVIVVELGEAAYAQETARRWADRYVFARHQGLFERARTLNIGTPLASHDLLLWLDNDIIMPPHFIERAVTELRERRLDCLVPYTVVSYLTAQSSEDVRRGVRNPAESATANVYHSRQGIHGAAVMVRKEFVMKYGGMCEEFQGWGGEDNAWLWKAQVLGQAAITLRQDQHLYHLYHPLSGGYGGQAHIAGNSHYQHNLAILREIRAIHQRDQFLRRFPAASTFSCPWRSDPRIVFLTEKGAAPLSRLAAAVAHKLLNWYGCRVEVISGDLTEVSTDSSALSPALMNADATVIFGATTAMHLLSNPSLAPIHAKMLVVTETAERLSDAEIKYLGKAGALLTTNNDAAGVFRSFGFNPWKIAASDCGDADFRAARRLTQPLSIVVGAAYSAPAPWEGHAARQPGAQSSSLPVWMYWEGECPIWIQECQKTIFSHAAGARLLTPESFDELRDRDREIDLSRLHVAQRADFIRAFLLAKYGGIWIDSDCLVMRSLQPMLELLDEYDFLCHRERQGHFSNGFIAARPGSRIAEAYYQRICEALRSGRPLGWTTLGSDALTEALRATEAPWREIECELIQPICWSDPGAFFATGDEAQHLRTFNPQAICYMLANQSLQRYLVAQRDSGLPDLLDERTFFSFLLRRAFGAETPKATADATTEAARPANNWRLLPFCLEAIMELAPQRVLELGPGLGRWGMLLREFCEEPTNGACREDWRLYLEGVALAPERIADHHRSLYNRLRVANGDELLTGDERWGLVIFGEVMWQWPREMVEAHLQRALDCSDYVLINTLPQAAVSNGGAGGGHGRLQDFLARFTVRCSGSENNHSQDRGAFLLSRFDPKRVKQTSPMERTFTHIFERNLSVREESVSGPGSCLMQTIEIRQRLPLLIADLGVKSMLDAPCGDFNWMRHVTLSLDEYIGGDIIPQLIAQNQQRYGHPNRKFIHLDLVAHPLPGVDLILCRDCLVHFSFEDVHKALRNLKRSRSTYLLMTHFPNHPLNVDIAIGEWRTLNFERPPFNFPPPLRVINEKCTEAGGFYSDKSLALWRLTDILPSL